ncbi:CDP-alcohol phosphatidyltransferase family protein [Flavobacterium sp. SM2513]|uniref:CDP-alcohol phosphatidyltransferase family protein n=1 Tax=Flavobacterium sp. SM2513 TaxID=3424766 RepID=UPI003D7F7479
MNIKKHIPNLITLLNLFSGCIALIYAVNMNFEMAFFFVSLGIFLDFFDGFFARLFKVSSPLGLQLDSLADMVTSGLVPGAVMFLMLNNYTLAPDNWIAYLGFIITLGSCYRLANFNIDTRQTDSFIGLPTPANTLLILSLPLVLQHTNQDIIRTLLENQWFLLAITVFSAFILNAEIPLFSLKIKEFNFAKNKLQIIFLASAVALLVAFQFLGIPLVIILYVLLSVLNNREVRKKSIEKRV